jgi:acetolactate synthase-1/3 small subunit
MSTHTLSALVENKPGVLAHVAGLFSRRSFNISSLAVGPTADEEVSRMTIVVDGASTPVEQVIRQLDKLVRVIKVVELADESAVERELALIKLAARPGEREEILQIAAVFGAPIVDLDPESIVLEATGSPRRIEALLDNLASYGIRELVRTGRVGLNRGPGAITDHTATDHATTTPELLAQAS